MSGFFYSKCPKCKNGFRTARPGTPEDKTLSVATFPLGRPSGKWPTKGWGCHMCFDCAHLFPIQYGTGDTRAFNQKERRFMAVPERKKKVEAARNVIKNKRVSQ